MEKMSHAEYIEQLQHEAGRVAVATVAGNLDILEACWVLGPLLAQAELAPGDPDAHAIGQVCSELDGLPVGEARALWSSLALERLAPELESLKRWALQLAMPAIQSVAARFGV
ncbi:hypothetical protein EAH75_19505 [Rhodanobacter glycinis]|nr:hypothetical protein EAH75_19505 [Rhodanobacter glycinis]